MGYGKILSMCAAVAITAGGLLLIGPPATGKTVPVVITAPEQIVARHISYADLNLASVPGETMLNSRVRGAIISLCDEATSESDGGYGHMRQQLQCTDGAWRQAKPQIAQAVQRARDIAFTGTSTLAAVAITISLPE